MSTTNTKKTSKKNLNTASASGTTLAAPSAGTTSAATTTQAANATANGGLTGLVNELSSFLDQAEARLGPEPAISTSAQKRRAAKPRAGFEKVISTIAPIVRQHQLESPSLNATDMLNHANTAQQLVPLQTRLQKVSKRVANETFNAQTNAWNMGLQFYSLLKRRAKVDGELAQNIEPLTKVFAYRHPVVKSTKPMKVQTRAKAKLKSAMKLAQRHGVGPAEAPTDEVVTATAPAAPVPALTPTPAPAQVATQVAPAAAPVASPPAPGAQAAPAASGPTNGAAGH